MMHGHVNVKFLNCSGKAHILITKMRCLGRKKVYITSEQHDGYNVQQKYVAGIIIPRFCIYIRNTEM